MEHILNQTDLEKGKNAVDKNDWTFFNEDEELESLLDDVRTKLDSKDENSIMKRKSYVALSQYDLTSQPPFHESNRGIFEWCCCSREKNDLNKLEVK